MFLEEDSLEKFLPVMSKGSMMNVASDPFPKIFPELVLDTTLEAALDWSLDIGGVLNIDGGAEEKIDVGAVAVAAVAWLS